MIVYELDRKDDARSVQGGEYQRIQGSAGAVPTRRCEFDLTCERSGRRELGLYGRHYDPYMRV